MRKRDVFNILVIIALAVGAYALAGDALGYVFFVALVLWLVFVMLSTTNPCRSDKRWQNEFYCIKCDHRWWGGEGQSLVGMENIQCKYCGFKGYVIATGQGRSGNGIGQ